MMEDGETAFFGFIVHAYPDLRRGRLYLLGRLEDGRSFAAVEENWRPHIHIFEKDRSRAMPLLGACKFEETAALVSFSGAEKLFCLKFSNYSSRLRACSALEEAHIASPDADINPADLFLIEKQIRGPVCLKGRVQPGKRVAVVFREPEISAPEQAVCAPLVIASIDIETDVTTGVIRAVSIAHIDAPAGKIAANENAVPGKVRVLRAESGERRIEGVIPIFHDDEKSMLCAFLEDIRAIDPDVLTGWNFLDFDFPHLAGRFEKLGLPFTLGRSHDNAKFFPGEDSGGGYWRRRSSAAIVPGRQVLDALRVMRTGMQSRSAGQGFSLEEIAQQVLGEGKTVHETGDEKIAALDRLYAQDPVRFGEYCLRDAQLVLRILAKTGLFRLTLERASLTGVSLDKAWTSVVSFERIYGMQLRMRGIAPPPPNDGADVTGAAGGTVLDPEPGLFNNVAVFDFRSLYPTIMRTFNIDPLSHARAGNKKQKSAERPVVAPNGAAFSREPGLLPALIGEYFATRRIALESGDEIAAQVYKILMNSFYGVLGTAACRYGKSELAGAITSFARKWLLFSRDWFNSRGLRVLYGDTDSLFVETGLNDGAPLAEFEELCARLAKELNLLITQTVKKEYDLESFIELRFEKAYRRFIIPPIRNFHASDCADSRGRAKGYGGYLLKADGSAAVEVKGMEAVRSDSTPLARRLQLELLELVFSGCTENEFRERVGQTIRELRTGALDNELVYRKRLTRYPETYTSSTPPQVKAARALGWKKRRGTVEYLWTVNGAEPVSLPHGKPDYDHYVESQVYPLVRSIASAAHWDADFFVTRKSQGRAEMQIELFG
jgi:DNA polymerase-2